MDTLLSTIRCPEDLKKLSLHQLEQLAVEIREAICRLACTRTAHFASNLGVVELSIALHTVFDFHCDRLVWDTGHQIYAHKLLTGRYDEFPTLRAKGGLMGYPNPVESEYDLFMTGHAGCSVATALGLRVGDDLIQDNGLQGATGGLSTRDCTAGQASSGTRDDDPRHVVAVLGDGALQSGIVFEAMNHAGGLKKRLLVVLNDNKMSICPRVGGLAESLDRLRLNPYYTGLKSEVQRFLTKMPLIGDPVERFLTQVKDAVKAGLVGGMFFEDLGFRYIGPVDGHNLRQLQKYLQMVRDFKEPVLLHVVTEKGHGFQPAAEDPTAFHAPAPFKQENGAIVPLKIPRPSYTQLVRDAIHARMKADPRVVAVTAAMCQGTMLEPIRDEFPDRFFDVGICESHAVAFAAGLARSGLRPVVAIYSTFMQRSYDQIFQEVSLQNLPVTLLLDRAGLVGPDGPTHHGVFDLAYLRSLPNLVVMAPGDTDSIAPMLQLALSLDRPAAIRYPKADAQRIVRPIQPLELGKAEVLHRGRDGVILACGTQLVAAVEAAKLLAEEDLDVGVINARFVKPLDTAALLPAIQESPFTVTVEEGVLMGGFGSAVLEAANEAGVNTARVRRLGVPDQFIEHAARAELLADLGLDAPGIAQACREMAEVKKGAELLMAVNPDCESR
ncbi:MAG: 1-deoxy-D-xylulose-5-phosphate synthase [Pirellulales bacterium]|nr:1-deoxy-D-xylulose-5-phosphate synthase [Pirellulales bacterium]